jgi:RNase H-fold protein (predicted Holliday junction resolvase)
MEKRHQVFVSSTCKDLAEARRVVMQALLEIDCIPTGMEVFPASDESAWELIENIIKGCDYYVLIIGGRYGSIGDHDGTSFTEREYSLAENAGIPVLAFVHADPDGLPVRDTDDDPSKKAALDKFRTRVMGGKLVKQWKSIDQLAAQVVTAITHAKKSRPRTGWIRADQAADPVILQRIEQLRVENDDLKTRLSQISDSAPESAARWEFGDEIVRLTATYFSRMKGTSVDVDINTSWQSLFRLLAPHAMTPVANEVLKVHLLAWVRGQLRRSDEYKSMVDLAIPNESFDPIMIQFFAIGLIKLVPTTTISTGSVWQLTPFGVKTLLDLLAKPRKQ